MAMSRTGIILAAITKQLDLRRAVLDQAEDLGEVTVVVRLMAGTSTVRATVVSEHHVNRRTVAQTERP
jgi:hypothetical protein